MEEKLEVGIVFFLTDVLYYLATSLEKFDLVLGFCSHTKLISSNGVSINWCDGKINPGVVSIMKWISLCALCNYRPNIGRV